MARHKSTTRKRSSRSKAQTLASEPSAVSSFEGELREATLRTPEETEALVEELTMLRDHCVLPRRRNRSQKPRIDKVALLNFMIDHASDPRTDVHHLLDFLAKDSKAWRTKDEAALERQVRKALIDIRRWSKSFYDARTDRPGRVVFRPDGGIDYEPTTTEPLDDSDTLDWIPDAMQRVFSTRPGTWDDSDVLTSDSTFAEVFPEGFARLEPTERARLRRILFRCSILRLEDLCWMQARVDRPIYFVENHRVVPVEEWGRASALGLGRLGVVAGRPARVSSVIVPDPATARNEARWSRWCDHARLSLSQGKTIRVFVGSIPARWQEALSWNLLVLPDELAVAFSGEDFPFGFRGILGDTLIGSRLIQQVAETIESPDTRAFLTRSPEEGMDSNWLEEVRKRLLK